MRKLRKYKSIFLLKVLNADRRAAASLAKRMSPAAELIRGRKQAEELRHVQSTDVTLLLLLFLLLLLLLLTTAAQLRPVLPDFTPCLMPSSTSDNTNFPYWYVNQFAPHTHARS